jgi:cytochrome c oxidase subunit II
LLKINSRDVIHDVGIPHFSVKMDAVPGMPTHFWFTPLYTTEEMAVKTGNPNFQYEIACDMLCGKGHSNMRGVIVVHDKEGFYDWYNKQPSFYDTQVKGTELEKKFALKTNDDAAVTAALVHN